DHERPLARRCRNEQRPAGCERQRSLRELEPARPEKARAEQVRASACTRDGTNEKKPGPKAHLSASYFLCSVRIAPAHAARLALVPAPTSLWQQSATCPKRSGGPIPGGVDRRYRAAG